MKIILQKDVKDLGKAGELVNVKSGYARNFLFPRNWAVEATEKKMNAWNHLQKMAEIKKKKAVSQRREILDKLAGQQVRFKLEADEDGKAFGSITSLKISAALSELGFEVDKRDIILEENIKDLGEYSVTIKFDAENSTEIKVTVEAS